MIILFWLGLTACSGGPTVPVTSGGLVAFPHAEGFKAGTLHGKEALDVGVAACETCHREDGTAAATCASCHAGYPHTDGWLAGAVHGQGLTGDEGPAARVLCMECHGGETGLVATTERSCTSCHASYPHPEGWADVGQHGLFALARGSAPAACGSCHGADLTGTPTAPSCTTCHTDYPHVEGWSDAAVHSVSALADMSSCEGCHGVLGTGGSAGVACARCHASFPHPTDWAKTHLGTVAKVGEAACASCHEAGFGPDTMIAPCGASCHGSSP